MEKKYYHQRFLATRSTFPMDMTDDERVIMLSHIDYWKDIMAKGMCLVFGPVLDPKGSYGVGILAVEDESIIEPMHANDPAVIAGLGYYECYPMRAVVPAV